MAASLTEKSFVGRRGELATLHRAFAAAADGHGRIIMLVGEPGIGKTRTTEEFAAWARDAGAEVLIGRCYEGDGAPAFWPWLQVLRAYVAARDAGTLAAELGSGAPGVAAFVSEVHSVLPDLPAPPILEPEQARFHFFDAVTTCLKRAAEARPLILVLDDLHGADQPSLLLLQFLAPEIRQARILVVGAHRDAGLEHQLAETLGELARERMSEWVRLGGLTVPEVAALMTSVAGTVATPELIAAVHERTGGNPFFVVEVARALDSAVMSSTFEIPESVRSAILRRLEILSSECQETVMLASFFGREFGAAALARASDVDVARVLALLDEAATARIVAPEADPSRWRFTHAIFGEVLAQAAPAAQRVAIHRRAAEALAASAAADEKAAEIAHHWLAAGEAGDPEQAVVWACRAGERALDVFAYEEAVRQYRLALTAVAWLDGRGAAREADVLLALAEAHRLAGEHEAAKTVFQRAAARARHLGSPELLTRAALGFAPTLAWAERPELDPAVVSLLEEAIVAWDGRDAALHARALARLGMGLMFGDVEQRWRLFDAAVAMARRVGDAATLRYVLACTLFMRRRCDALEADLALATGLVDSAARAGDMEPLLHGRLARIGLLLECGDLFTANREAALFTRLAEELRQPVWTWLAKNLAGARAIRDGRFADAERDLQDAAEFGQAIVPFAAASHYAGAMILLQTLQGKTPEVMPMFRAIADTHPEPAAVTPIAWVESELGEEEAARQRVERLGRFDGARDTMWMLPAGFLGATCANLDDGPLCATWYENLLPYAGRWIVWADLTVLWPVDQMLAALARVLGRFGAGIAHAESALAAAAAAGARPCVARVQYELARLLRARDAAGDAARARTLLTTAKAGRITSVWPR